MPKTNPLGNRHVRDNMCEYVREGSLSFFTTFFSELVKGEPDPAFLDAIAEGLADAIVAYGAPRSPGFGAAVALTIIDKAKP